MLCPNNNGLQLVVCWILKVQTRIIIFKKIKVNRFPIDKFLTPQSIGKIFKSIYNLTFLSYKNTFVGTQNMCHKIPRKLKKDLRQSDKPVPRAIHASFDTTKVVLER